MSVIKKSKHYIYIENQFFISSLPEHEVGNKIADALIERILTAHKNNEAFRVFVVMPLLPSFPGEIGELGATAMCFVEHWNLSTSRNIINQLVENGVEDPNNYISICGLRNYASDFGGKMVTEIVYIHSKLMIVDDHVVIMGSANVNDRSMLGCRDSEVAIVIEDTNMIPGIMNGEETPVGSFASSLRINLFKEHLGLSEGDENACDPICEDFYKDTWRNTAKTNADIYEKLFKCLPSNEVHSFEDLQTYKATPGLAVNSANPAEARCQLRNVRGFLVEKPLDFLKNQDLFPPVGSKESLVPITVFT